MTVKSVRWYFVPFYKFFLSFFFCSILLLFFFLILLFFQDIGKNFSFIDKLTLLPSWQVNWDVVFSPNNITDPHCVKWINKSFTGYCGSQVYPMLANKSGFAYLWVHDVMSIENGTQAWIFATDPSGFLHRRIEPLIFTRLYSSQMLCAFNDGTSVISHEINTMRRKNLDFVIIICDIPKHLQSAVLNTNESSSIGITLFDIRTNRSQFVVDNNGTLQWNNVTIPLCSSFVINNGMSLYRNDGPLYNQVYSSSINTERKYFLSACLIVHPSGDKNRQITLRIQEWLQYAIMMGWEHFYIFDHLFQRENDSSIFQNLLPYIQNDIVTYIPWYQPYSQPWIFQFSFINSCLKRFQYENNYLSVIDIDEYLIPFSNMTVSGVLKQMLTSSQTNMFVLKCKLATTCISEMGCNHSFQSFVSRHRCISNDTPPTDPKKYIVNPMAMWYAFVHGIPRWKNNVNNVALSFNGICIHARDHHLPENVEFSPHIENLIKRLHIRLISKEKVKPVLHNKTAFCN